AMMCERRSFLVPRFTRSHAMALLRAASVSTILVLMVWSGVGSIALSGQISQVRARSVEQYRGRRVMAREVLAVFRGTASPPSAAALDLTDDERLFTGVRRQRARRGGVAELMAALAARPDVEYVEPNYLIEPSIVPSDPFFPLQTGLFN